MATNLDKTVTRESKEIIKGRNIIVSMTDDQKISMKLKGMKSGTVDIKIKDLYEQLAESSDNIEELNENDEDMLISIDHSIKEKKNSNNPLFSLHDFRSQYLISPDIPLEIKVKLEGIIVRLIEETKKGKL